MPDLSFQIESVQPAQFAAVPQLLFQLRIRDGETAAMATVQSLSLNVQIRIEPTRRGYQGVDAPGLRDLFGDPLRWGATMRSLLWTHVTCVVPAFTGETIFDLSIPCSFDFNVAATKYFASLEAGDIPLCFLFSGTMFYQSARGLQAGQISWEKEAVFRLPAETWHELMRRHFPDAVWLNIPRDLFAELQEFKNRQGLPSWDQALARLLTQADRNEVRT
ncbi:MAG TPA: DUF6084 family protein [Pirellulales bacterium]|jgi:hypothetical protein